MKKIGIFFGSDTGNTENIANIIKEELGNKNSDIFDIAKTKKKDIENYNNLIFGVPTWYYGEIQCDWENFLPNLEKIKLKNKNIAIFGCGDQEDYSEYFCDAIGILGNKVKSQGAYLIGKWSTSGYNFESSKGLLNKNYFMGLAIDEDRQAHLTNKRIKIWIEDIKKNMNVNSNN